MGAKYKHMVLLEVCKSIIATVNPLKEAVVVLLFHNIFAEYVLFNSLYVG